MGFRILLFGLVNGRCWCIRRRVRHAGDGLHAAADVVPDHLAAEAGGGVHRGGAGLDGAGEGRRGAAQAATARVGVEPDDVADVVGVVAELALRHRREGGGRSDAGVLAAGGEAGF